MTDRRGVSLIALGLTGLGLAIIAPERAILLGVGLGVLASPLGYAKSRHIVRISAISG